MKRLIRLKEFRDGLQRSSREMADIIGISLSLYEKIERGARNPSYHFLLKFKAAFPTADIGWIFFACNEHETCASSKAS